MDDLEMDKRKRILQANLNNQGGAFSVVYEAQQKMQDEYVFDYFFPDRFVKNNVYDKLIDMGSRCVGELECKNRFLKQYEIFRQFKEYLEHNSYEYVHIHADTAWKILIYYLAARGKKVKNIVVHSHSSGINGHYKIINYILHILARFVISKADIKCACSDVAARWMYGTTKEIICIRNGVDVKKYKYNADSRNRVRDMYDIQGKTVIGHVSDFSYPKNPEFLMKLFKTFNNKEKYVFLMVGNRASGCRLKEQVEKNPEIDNVIFTGSVTNVEAYLSAMDIFVLPSKFEGLPMCALEAQVSGLYTIVSDRVSEETKCSEYFSRLNLNTSEWVRLIEEVALNYDRSEMTNFLQVEKVDSLSTAKQFKQIYGDIYKTNGGID